MTTERTPVDVLADRTRQLGVADPDRRLLMISWLRAGEALSAAWLTATEHGVAVLSFSAPMEASVTRVVLRRLLAGLGQPYLVLLLGRPDPDHPGPPHTPRLDPTQTVDIVDTDH